MSVVVSTMQACLFAVRCGSYLALYSGSCMGMRLTVYVTDACLTLEIEFMLSHVTRCLSM